MEIGFTSSPEPVEEYFKFAAETGFSRMDLGCSAPANFPHTFTDERIRRVRELGEEYGARVITIDRRITPAENFEDAHNEIQKVLDELKAGDPELDIELITKTGMHPVASEPDSELVKVLKSAGEDIRGGEPVKVTGSQGSSDYSWYVNILGKPAASYSMSSTERRGHAPNEYILVDDLVKTAKAYALTYMRYLGAEPL